MDLIGQAVSEKIFENGGRRDDGGTPDNGHPISPPSEPNGSSELKNVNKFVPIFVCDRDQISQLMTTRGLENQLSDIRFIVLYLLGLSLTLEFKWDIFVIKNLRSHKNMLNFMPIV